MLVITTEKLKVKNNDDNGNNRYDIFDFFLKYQQASKQREEGEQGIAHI
jgi:hypothetical protein